MVVLHHRSSPSSSSASQAHEHVLLGACGWTSCAIWKDRLVLSAGWFYLGSQKCLVNVNLQMETQVMIHMSGL